MESHRFAPVERLQWRNPDLDDTSLEALQYTLGRPSRDPALERVGEASDERALGVLSSDREIRDRATSPAAVRRLWDACRLPDFRKATLDAHARLIKSIYMHLTGPGSRLPDDWMNGQLARFRKTSGDVDALAARLAHVRTWAYAAHRSDWTRDPGHWRGVTREIEDRLSDALHERLMQRFVDRRTSALVKGLRDERDLLAGVASNGEVTVEGHFVGRLAGLTFKPDADGRELAARTLKSAALRALRPEINRRLGALAKTKMEDLTFSDDGKISWGGDDVAQLIPGPTPLKPAVKLLGGDLGAAEAQSRARAGLEAGLTAHIETQLAPLFKLRDAGQSDDMPGLARGLAWRLYEAGGALPRHDISDDVRNLSQVERRSLRAAGVRIGEHMIYVPELVKPARARLNALLHAIAAGRTDLAWLPAPGLTSVANDRSRTRAEYAAIGFQPCGPRAVRFDMLERLADTLREAGKDDGPGFPLTADMTALLGCSVEDIRGTLTELGYRRIQKGPDPEKAEGERWDRRRRKHAGQRGAPRKPAARAAEPVIPSDSPFAALAELTLPEQPKRKPRPPRKRRKDKPKAATAQAATQATAQATTRAEAGAGADAPSKSEAAAPAETAPVADAKPDSKA